MTVFGVENAAEADSAGPMNGVVRAYKGQTGEHFYTLSASEATNAGFTIEANPYFHLARYDIGGVGLLPFYRCYWHGAGKHFYTTSPSCEGAAAVNEGPLGLISPNAFDGGIPLYRMYQGASGDHFYTIDIYEALNASRMGYQFEAIVGYVWQN